MSQPTQLGEKYRDTQTGIEGVAISSTKYQHGCERVQIEFVAAGKVEIEVFDAPRLVRVSDNSPIAHEARPGGNQAIAARASVPRR
jgi:hypothetical protein